jgi:spore coat protein U-like protein
MKGLLLLASAVAIALPGYAATSTSQFRVTLTIQAECKVTSTTDIAFGTTGVIQSQLSADGQVVAQCTNTTPYNIGLNAGAGAGASVTTRKMTSGSGATVDYTLYRDSGASQVWGDTINTNTVAATGTGGLQSYTVYGRVPVQSTPAAGAYTDTVQVVITY